MCQPGTKACSQTGSPAYNFGSSFAATLGLLWPSACFRFAHLTPLNFVPKLHLSSPGTRLNWCKLALLETCAPELPKQWDVLPMTSARASGLDRTRVSSDPDTSMESLAQFRFCAGLFRPTFARANQREHLRGAPDCG
jgi:hypothetical protein